MLALPPETKKETSDAPVMEPVPKFDVPATLVSETPRPLAALPLLVEMTLEKFALSVTALAMMAGAAWPALPVALIDFELLVTVMVPEVMAERPGPFEVVMPSDSKVTLEATRLTPAPPAVVFVTAAPPEKLMVAAAAFCMSTGLPVL